MFNNYSSEYASQITALAGFLIVASRAFGFDIAESDIIFGLGALANVAGMAYALYTRYQRGGVDKLGRRT